MLLNHKMNIYSIFFALIHCYIIPSSILYKKQFSSNLATYVIKNTSMIQNNRSVSNMPADHVLGLYQLMKDIHEVFTTFHLEYWVQAGTLLGAVRHKGLIPWDDDLDININIKDEALFLALRPIFDELGYFYHLAISSSVPLRIYKIHPKRFRSLCVDIFLTIHNKDNTISFTPYYWLQRDGKPMFITKDELYPLKQYQFGAITVMGPNNPYPFLNASYGTDWQQYAIKWNHSSNPNEKYEKILLTDEDKQPAQPTGPLLQDRFTNCHIEFPTFIKH